MSDQSSQRGSNSDSTSALSRWPWAIVETCSTPGPSQTPPIFSTPASTHRGWPGSDGSPPMTPAGRLSSLRASSRQPSFPRSAESSRFVLSSRVPPSPNDSRGQCGTEGRNRDLLVDDFQEPDAMNEIIMALDMQPKGTVGCAYYMATKEALYLQDDILMGSMDVVEMLLLKAEPTTILLSTRSPEKLFKHLERGAHGFCDNTQDDESRGAYILKTVGSADFKYESSLNKLLSLKINVLHQHTVRFTTATKNQVADGERRDEGAEAGQREAKIMRLASLINLEARVSVGCAGAVLKELQRRKAAEYIPSDPTALFAFRVKTVEMLTLSDSMFVIPDVFTALQIVRKQSHPNGQMQDPSKSMSGAKESLSLYGLFFMLACTPQGKAHLRQLFLQPRVDLDVIQERQKTIAVLLRSANREALTSITQILRKIKNVRTCLHQLRKGVDTPSSSVSADRGVWLILQRFSLHVRELCQSIRSLDGMQSLNLVTRVLENIKARKIFEVGELITQTVDFEHSREQQRTATLSGVDSDLDALKRTYTGLGDLLTQAAERLRHEVPEWARGYITKCLYYPQLGFFVSVSINRESGRANYEGEGLADDVWESKFAMETEVCYKNRYMKGLDEEVGDLYSMIADREIELVHDLSVKVLRYEEVLIAASEAVGEFDCMVALALGAEKYHLTAPTMTEDNILRITGGRHILQELVTSPFIPNDCRLSGGRRQDIHGDGNSAIIDDEDTEETSLLLLAHIGSFVPAETAVIGLTDRMLTRISTRESVSNNESAFAADLRQAAFVINMATRRSLIVIDEFGKGTNSMDGAGLMTGLLSHFLELGGERPRVLAATHFHEIFENEFLHEGHGLEFAHMEVRLDPEAHDLDDHVTYLYHLVSGRSTSSFGNTCAALNGVDGAVVARAEAIVSLLSRGEDLEAACSKLSAEETEKLETSESTAREFLGTELPQGGNHRLGSKRKAAEVTTSSARVLLNRILAISGSPSLASNSSL